MPRRRFQKGQPKRDEARSRDDDINWRKPLEKNNELFERYYKQQNLIAEEEWSSFMDTLRNELPVVFRITGSRKHAQKLLDFMESEYMAKLIEGVEVDGERVEAPRKLSWYPDGLAFQLDASRRFVRKSDELRRFHAWLVAETEAGNVSRQEAVSMLPPLLLDVAAGQLILDICAAPGSKTAQILEMLEQRASDGDGAAAGAREGLIVANDVDGKRCYLMVHQVKRLHSPNVVVINHDGTNLPNLLVDRRTWEAFRGSSEDFHEEERVPVQFDRVLCDVPCSGDGTVRKNPDVWSRWAPGTAISLHGVQLRLLRRALELVRVGGRVVYSTCSLNPVENEAVVASMLRTANYDTEASDKEASYTKCVEVLDCSSQLEGLKRAPGATQWTLMDKTGKFYDRFDDVPANMQRHFRPSMFPPQASETTICAELRKCIRVLPHYQNTGGFFVCVFQKSSELSWQRSRHSKPSNAKDETEAPINEAEAETDTKSVDTSDNDEPSKRAKMEEDASSTQKEAGVTYAGVNSEQRAKVRERGAIRNPGFREPPFRFLEPESDQRDAQLVDNLREYFALSQNFRFDLLFARGERAAKTWANMYLASAFVRALVVGNADRVHFVNLGLRALIRNEEGSAKCRCEYRIAQEALVTFDRYLGLSRRIAIGRADCVALLSSPIPPLSALSFETREAFDRLDLGPVVFDCFYTAECPPTQHDDSRFLMGGWRGRATLRAYLPLYERRNLLSLCGVHQDPADLQKAATEEKKTLADAGSSEIDCETDAHAAMQAVAEAADC